ncbi:MAG: phospho-N-acetylmuramoyl-pentapeptide-transferase [Candidatus Omnitrophota bacterium]
MFYQLLYSLKDFWFGFNIFKYITFRASMAAVMSFVICVFLGPVVIRLLKRFNVGQYVRKENVEDIYDLHKNKQGTPTMGGLLILVSVGLSTLFWCRLDNDYVLLALAGMIWLGGVGFIDDFMKMRNKSPQGIQAVTKLAGQILLSLIVGLFVINDKNIGAGLYVPFIKNVVINLGIFYIFFVLLVVTGASNAVNLTDGLDGLAVGSAVFVAFTYAVISYITGHADISKYLHIFYLPGAGELTVFCAALTGACLGFLWFNSYPATVFMGDTGSLSIGGAVAIVSVILKKEVLLLLCGGIFVMEAVSVILQVFSYKTRKKRIFLMAPVHHHFQIKGWQEPKIIMRFLIIAAVLALLSIATLKIQ